jgi:hypothetical protein
MRRDNSDDPKQRLIGRAFRWQPVNLIQVWLMATAAGLIIFAADWAAFGKPLDGLIFAVIFAGMFGAAQTYRLH